MILEGIPSFSLLEEFKKDWYEFFVCLVEFYIEVFWDLLQFAESFVFVFTYSISLPVISKFKLLFPLDSALVCCMFLEASSFF